MSQYPLFGIIGGTSGTLDIAAFLGINCYNFHQFIHNSPKYATMKRPQAHLQAQEYRILLQGSFMTIVPPWDGSAQHRDWLATWLRQGTIVMKLPNTRLLMPPPKSKNHKDRHPFTCFDEKDVADCPKESYHPYQEMIDNIVLRFFQEEEAQQYQVDVLAELLDDIL